MSKPTDLDAVQKLCDAATPGPWTDEHGVVSAMVDASDGERCHTHVADDLRHADSAFIAHARTLIPEMAAEIRELRAELAAERAKMAMATKFRVGSVSVWLQFKCEDGWALLEDGGSGCEARYGLTREEAIAHARRLAAGGEEK